MISAEQKKEVINKFKRSENDTGSAEVQVALLTARIKDLQTHFAKHKQDKHSRRGLLKLVAERRKMLNYLFKVSVDRYRAVISQLGLRY